MAPLTEEIQAKRKKNSCRRAGRQTSGKGGERDKSVADSTSCAGGERKQHNGGGKGV